MNLSKSIFIAAAAALIIGTGTVARATENNWCPNVANGYYQFTATDGNNQLNGSWVEFACDQIVNWNLVDTTDYLALNPVIGTDSSYGYPGLFPPLTPSNSSVIPDPYAFTAPGDQFAFEIGSPIGTCSTDNSIFWFSGYSDGSADGGSALYDGTTGNQLYVDPQGNWNFSLTQPVASSAPDAAATFELLFGALIALGACKSFFRRRVAVRS